LEGKAAVAEYMRDYPDHIDLHDFPYVEIHQTLAPETIVVEMRGVGRLVDTDSPFDMSYIAVVTVKDGLITHYRDYWNPLAVQDPATNFAGGN
jgi:ketosteroid isomerase-like protein